MLFRSKYPRLSCGHTGGFTGLLVPFWGVCGVAQAQSNTWRAGPSFSGHGEVCFLCFLPTATPSTTASATMAADCDNPSRPSTPPNPIPLGYFPATFERFVRENEMADLASAFTLLGEYCPMSDLRDVGWSSVTLLGRYGRDVLRCTYRPHPKGPHETQRSPQGSG